MVENLYGVGGIRNAAPPVINIKNDPPANFRGQLGQFCYNTLEIPPTLFIYDGMEGVPASFNAGFPITPYVVGPVDQADFQTIQAALNAATAAGGGIVYVMPGTYTENLILFGNTGIVGTPGNSDAGTAGNTTVIVGTHTPPSTGSFSIVNVKLVSATDVFASTAPGSSAIIIENAFIAITSGYLFNLPNWTSAGAFITYNIGEGSTNNGMVLNNGGATCFFISATHGAGTANTMITSGFVDMQEVDLNCPWNAETGTIIACDYVIFTHNVTCSNNSTGSINFSRFSTGAAPSLTMSSSGAVSLGSCLINSSNNPSITGAGAGVLTLNGITWITNSNVSGSLTLAGTSLTSLTNTSLSTGTLSIKSTSVNNGNNAGFIEMIVAGATVFVPYFSNISP